MTGLRGKSFSCFEELLKEPVWIDVGEPREKQCDVTLLKGAGAKSLSSMFITLDLILK